MMVSRLRAALAEGRSLVGADANYYLHELNEATLMSRGASYEEAHAAALQRYGVPPQAIYHPDVIRALGREYWHPSYFTYWGIP